MHIYESNSMYIICLCCALSIVISQVNNYIRCLLCTMYFRDHLITDIFGGLALHLVDKIGGLKFGRARMTS